MHFYSKMLLMIGLIIILIQPVKAKHKLKINQFPNLKHKNFKVENFIILTQNKAKT